MMIETKDGIETWLDVCAVEDVPFRGARRIQTAHGELGLFRSQEGEFFAIKNSCPHQNGPLTEGIMHDCAVTCPLHSWIIDLKTGKVRGSDEGEVATYKVEVRSGRVFLEVAT